VSYIAEGVRREKVMRVFVALLDAAAVRQAVADAPVIGNGAGVIPWIHVDDAAATVLALDHEGPAIDNIAGDEPAATSEWLPVLADAIRARPRPAMCRPGRSGSSQARTR
jgi:nucleoside-diphosphate-sugar epimerase